MKTPRHSYYLLFLLITGSTLACQQGETSSQSPSSPNFVFILVDDLGWADLGCYGSTFHETPNIDQLAAEGVRFTEAYAACPVCSPTRASIMSGKYPARIHLTDWIKGRQNRLPQEPGHALMAPEFEHQMALEEVTIAEALQEAGYSTFFAGKWHMGEAPEYWPEHQGFDINKGGHNRGSPPGGYFSPYKNPRLEDGPEGEHLTDRLATESIQFLESVGENPFLLYLSFYTVHTPLQGKDSVIAKYQSKADGLNLSDEQRFERAAPWMATAPQRGRWLERKAQDHPIYGSMMESLDQNVGRVMDKLKELGLDENTVVFFMSDNGGLATSEGSPTSNLPLRAGKGWLYEGGIREPMLIKWPGQATAGSTCEYPVTSTDFYPTILEMAGLSQKPEQHMDGVSMVPLLKGNASLDRSDIFWHYPHYSNQGGRPGGVIRSGKYKLIEFYEDGARELYDLSTDVGEQHNLVEKYPAIADSLGSRLQQWLAETDAAMPVPNPTYEPNYQREVGVD